MTQTIIFFSLGMLFNAAMDRNQFHHAFYKFGKWFHTDYSAGFKWPWKKPITQINNFWHAAKTAMMICFLLAIGFIWGTLIAGVVGVFIIFNLFYDVIWKYFDELPQM